MWSNQMMWGDGWGGVGWAWFGLMHVLWWVLVIAGIVAVIRWLVDGGRRGRPADENRALDILKERFARGEIDKDEYEERRRILKG
jgi:putative membrane protein